MNRLTNTGMIVFIAASALTIPAWHLWHQNNVPSISATRRLNHLPCGWPDKMHNYIASVKKFAAENNFNARICMIADMTIPSGKRRFEVYDLLNDTVLVSGLVAHGSCDEGFQANARFSNNMNCGCSCFGRFRIGESYNGKFGTAFKLFGLDSSNSNAYRRGIVLHAYPDVPDDETYPLPICNSRGCAMVSTRFLRQLRQYIDNASKPVLLCIIK